MHETLLWEIGGLTFHGKTLVMTWIVMAIIIVFVLSGVRNLTSGKPGKMQNILEWMVDFVRKIISDNMDYKKGKPLLGYLITLILFVFVSNVFGLLPNLTFGIFNNIEFAKLNEIFEGALLMSPTADVNTTLALGIMTMGWVVYMGIKNKGAGYFRHFIEPNPLFFLIHVIDFISKPMTLAFRLFGNIYAGEVLLAVILMVPGYFVLGMVVPDAIWLGFSVFIGAIQAFVFTVLTTAYVAQAVVDD
ncbi:MAG: F0F1 ATP synthase subunit A [Desulfitobacterium sp.]|nr:F0F1 ATP synthase subunit A [Desulfitobacterium sp.]